MGKGAVRNDQLLSLRWVYDEKKYEMDYGVSDSDRNAVHL